MQVYNPNAHIPTLKMAVCISWCCSDRRLELNRISKGECHQHTEDHQYESKSFDE
ncbi:unnamed protein product [Staurois parvus]|uniref:Uncharacterized protein n=1 Tax=Staurois parvus TaxID=386267 RepID=A0ABN9GSE7_9NEOB|nr:unnamed protein product [Staurois parvus]